jgi:hypothetical protein
VLRGENVSGKSSVCRTGDSTCGGEVVYTIPEIRVLLRSQPDDAQRWLTTSQMGWALTRERNETTNEKDERDCKPVARQLAPMISKFIRAKWESHEMQCMEDERRQLLEEAVELDDDDDDLLFVLAEITNSLLLYTRLGTPSRDRRKNTCDDVDIMFPVVACFRSLLG